MAGIFEGGEDFSNNLASDIAPLLALFGEQVTAQFMSQSTGWADCILLAMAPIGVITIIMSAIRVGGSNRLKGIIGRGRETTVSTELEVMSSTSDESCELWNGRGVVKCQGKSSISEFICIYPTKDDTAEAQKPDTSCFKSAIVMDYDQAHIKPDNQFGYFRNASSNPVVVILKNLLNQKTSMPEQQSDPELGQCKSKISARQKNDDTSDCVTTLADDGNSQPELEASDEVSQNKNHQVRSPSVTKDQIIIIRDKLDESPNISLNCHTDGYRPWVWLYAALSVILQAGVLVYFVFVTVYPALKFKKDNKPVDAFAMPVAAIGTLLLVIGMLICSFIVNDSTAEKLREVDSKKYAIATLWLQKEKRISDQLFHSTALYPQEISHKHLTSKRKETSYNSAINPSPSEDDKLLTPEDKPSTKQKPNRELLTTFGVLISVIGIGSQFTGLRGMHWTAAIAQLIAIIVVAILRAMVRLHTAPQVIHRYLISGFELDWFVMSIVGNSGRPWLETQQGKTYNPADNGLTTSDKSTSTAGKDPGQSKRKGSCAGFTLDTSGSKILDDSNKTRKKKTDPAQCEGIPKGPSRIRELQTAQGTLDLRRHLGELGEWESPVSKEATVLSRAIEETLRFFTRQYPEVIEKTDAIWRMQVGIGSRAITFEFQRGQDGAWQSSRLDIEAALSLCVYSDCLSMDAQSASDCIEQPAIEFPLPEDARMTKDDRLNRQCVQVLGPATPGIKRDLEYWLPDTTEGISKVSTEELERAKAHKIIGRSGHRRCSGGIISAAKSRPESKGLDASQETPVEWWVVGSSKGSMNLHARDIFSSFVWALARKVSDKAAGLRLGANVERPDHQGSSASPKLRNQQLSSLVQSITEQGSWTTWQVFLCLIPALSACEILPGARPFINVARRAGVAFERIGNWKEAFAQYQDLHRISVTHPLESHIRWVSLAILFRFDARISKQGIKSFGMQRDKAYESDDVGEIRDKIRVIFSEEEERHRDQYDKHDKHDTDQGNLKAYKTLEEAFYIHKIFPSKDSITQSLLHVVVWDLEKDLDLWRPQKETKDSYAKMKRGSTPTTRSNWDPETSDRDIVDNDTFDRDIFDRTPLHHAMGSNVPIKAIPEHIHENHQKGLREKAGILSKKTNNAISWSKVSMRAQLDPAVECFRLLRQGANPSALDLDHWTPLHYACHLVLPRFPKYPPVPESDQDRLRENYAKRAKQKAEALIWRKVDVNARGLDGTTPLHCAAASGCKDLAIYLVTRRANIDAQKIDGTTPLHCAVMSGCVDLVKYFLRQKAAVTTSADGRTLLHMAAMAGESRMLSWLQANAEERDQAGRTPLHLAAMSGSHSSVKEMLDLGANRDARDHNGRTPLHLATLYDSPDAIKALLDIDRGKKPSVYIDLICRDELGRTPLHLAAMFDSKDAIKVLLGPKSSSIQKTSKAESAPEVGFSAKDMEGQFPIHLAAFSNATRSMEILLNHMRSLAGDRPRISFWPPLDEDDQTPYHLAAKGRHSEMIELISASSVMKEFDPKASSLLAKSRTDEMTAFAIAAHNGDALSMDAFLDADLGQLEKSAKDSLKKTLLTEKNKNGDTPIDDAISNRLFVTLRRLFDAADKLEMSEVEIFGTK